MVILIMPIHAMEIASQGTALIKFSKIATHKKLFFPSHSGPFSLTSQCRVVLCLWSLELEDNAEWLVPHEKL